MGIRDSNGFIKMVACRHMALPQLLRNGVLITKNKDFLNLEIEGDSNIVMG